MTISTGLLTRVVSRVFELPKDVSSELIPEVERAVSGIAKVGARQVKEMVLALPIFLLFVRELLSRRNEFEAQKQLFVIGAAAAFSTLGMVILGTALSSLPVQILLLFSNPALAIALLTSGGLFIAAVIVLLSWLIIYALNFVLDDDPAFQKIRDEFLPPETKALVKDIEKAVRKGGGDPDKLGKAVAKGLKARGKGANAAELEKSLTRVHGRLQARDAERAVKSDRRVPTRRRTRTRAQTKAKRRS